MIRAGDSIENPVTGERIVIRSTARETEGEAVVLEVFLRPTGLLASELARPAEEVRFQILRGSVGFLIGEKALVARPGDRLTLLPGTPYEIWNAADETHLVCEVRPAQAFEADLERLHAGSSRMSTSQAGVARGGSGGRGGGAICPLAAA